MNGFKLFGRELKWIFSDMRTAIPILAILLVPLIYAGMFLWAFKDPYAKMDELPVAVIDNDEGAVFNGETLHLGKDLEENLEESDAFNFQFVSEKDGMEGLEDLTYYMVIKIPEDFSENATTLLDENPKKLELQYIPNDSYNFLASQIGETATKSIQAELSSQVSKTYSETIFSKITEMADGFKEASDGAEQLNDGALSLNEGAAKLTENLKTLASKSIEFQNGLSTAKSGSTELENGTAELATGLGKLTDASKQLVDGSKSLSAGTSSLTSGIDSAASSMQQLNDNYPMIVKGTEEVQNGLETFQTELPKELAKGITEQIAGSSDEMTAGINQLNASIDTGLSDELVPQLSEGLSQKTAEEVANMLIENQTKQLEQISQLLASNNVEEKDAIIAALSENTPSKEALQQSIYESLKPSFTEGINAGVQQSIADIDDGFDQYQQGLSSQLNSSNMEEQIAAEIAPAFNQLTSGLSEIHKNQLAVQEGISKLSDGLNQLNAGGTQLQSGEDEWATNMELFGSKVKEAENGAIQLEDGSHQLVDGLDQLVTGAAAFSDGSAQLADGATQLSEGTNELQDGTSEMSTKLKDASDEASSVEVNDKTYEMMSNPVDLDVEHVNRVPNYGTGFAPYFISLGLFVGALLLTIVFPLVDVAGKPKNGISWFISKFGVMASVGIIQAVLTDLIVLYGLDIHVESVPLFFLFTIIVSLAFITLIQLLVTIGGNPGRFVAILILILQLTSSAGTFPLEVIPKEVQWFNPLLPMTYTVSGLKAVISMGDYDFMWKNAGILSIYIVLSIVITSLFFISKFRRKAKHDSELSKEKMA